MDDKKKIALVAMITLLGMALIGYAIIGPLIGSGQVAAPGEYDDLAKCLAEKGVSMGGAEWCSACNKQKALFGTAFRFVDYKNCEADSEWCIAQKLEFYPTWVFADGSQLVGVQSLEKLAEKAGCEI